MPAQMQIRRAEHLAQFADLASVFLTAYLDKGVPKCGLLSIGSSEKGDELTAATFELLKENEQGEFYRQSRKVYLRW